MRATILKIAGAKNEGDFYKMFPDEASFLKKHGKAFEKAKQGMLMKYQQGGDIDGDGVPDLLQGEGMAYKNMFKNSQSAPLPNIPNLATPPINGNEQFGNSATNPFQQYNTPSAGNTWANNNPLPAGVQNYGVPQHVNEESTGGQVLDAFSSIPIVGSIFDGISDLISEKKAVKSARQAKDVSDLTYQASQSRDVNSYGMNNINKKNQALFYGNTISGDMLNPTKGVGTNVLAQDGAMFGPENELIDKYPVDKSAEILKREAYGPQNMQGPLDLKEYIAPEQLTKVSNKSNFDPKSARDNWERKTGLPWSEAKRLGYSDGSAKSNIALLNSLNNPNFNPINIKSTAPRGGKQNYNGGKESGAPGDQKQNTSSSNKLKSFQEAMAGKPNLYKSNNAMFSTSKKSQLDREKEAQRKQAQFDDYLVGERILLYLANPSLGFGDLKKALNPNTPDDETSKAYRDQIMENRYNPNITHSEAMKRKAIMGLKETPKAALNVASALSMKPYTTFESMPSMLGQGAAKASANKALGQGAQRLGAGAAKQIAGQAPKMISPSYNPNFIMYEDGGFIPLDNTYEDKQYQYGGIIPSFGTGVTSGGGAGFMNFMNSGGKQAVDAGVSMIPGQGDGGSKIGSGVGSAVDAFLPMFGGMFSTLGGLAGGLIDTNDNKIAKANKQVEQNVLRSAAGQYGAGNQFNSFAEDGITLYRAGGNMRGNYTAPSARALDTYEDGGNVETVWGGDIENVSYNPYAGGVSMELKGSSHDNGGIGVSYGGNLIEAEPEPMQKLPNPETGEEAVTIFGASDMGLMGPEYKGSFKNFGYKKNKEEAKINKMMGKASVKADNADTSKWGKLDLSTSEAILKGSDMKLKEIAVEKQKAANFQNALLKTAKDFGLEVNALSKGKHVIDKKARLEALTEVDDRGYAKDGITIAQDGVTFGTVAVGEGRLDELSPEQRALAINSQWQGQNYENVWTPKVNKVFDTKESAVRAINQLQNYTGQDARDVQAILAKAVTMDEKIAIAKKLALDGRVGPYHRLIDNIISKERPAEVKPIFKDEAIKDKIVTPFPNEEFVTNPWAAGISSLMPYIRPSDATPLKGEQLYGEMNALANNQLDGVQANFYHPDLNVPYDVSFQDQINNNQGQYRAAQRMMGYNPGAQVALNAGMYDANDRVLAEQFRQNQGERNRVFEGNRGIMNDSKLKNLAIADQQYDRQAQAVANTKSVNQDAINSMSDKWLQNDLENNRLRTYENMYNYRYGKDFRVDNWNGPVTFNTEMRDRGSRASMSDAERLMEIENERDAIKEKVKEAKKANTVTARNGGVVSAWKKL